MADPFSTLVWTLILLATALFLALAVITQVLATYTTAYLAAETEIATFLDTVGSSIEENESYHRDVAKVQRLEDKLRLGRLLSEIQKSGDDLREDLNRLVVAEGGTTLRTSTRILWASHRRRLEERVRRIDLLRTRFLVMYMGIIATMTGERAKYTERTAPKDPEKAALHQLQTPRATIPTGISEALSDSIKKRPQLRSVTTPTGHGQVEQPHRIGWIGVVQELQRSPLMHRRHASIENAMRSPPPMSPLGSPLGSPRTLTPKTDNDRIHEAFHSSPETKI
ncbi:hypothetical protein AAE478_006416 [Parahypoxylon ruwenzoriense]